MNASLEQKVGQAETLLRSGRQLESADLAAVIVEMQSLQTTIQFNYAALSIARSNNLLEFLG